MLFGALSPARDQYFPRSRVSNSNHRVRAPVVWTEDLDRPQGDQDLKEDGGLKRPITAPTESGQSNTDDQRVALPTPAAERRRTGTATSPLELVGECQDDAGAGHADRV